MRLLLALAAFGIAAGAGAAKRARLARRVEALERFTADVRSFRDAAELSPRPITALAPTLSCTIWQRFCGDLDKKTLEEAWNDACKSETELAQDIELVRSFSAVLTTKELCAQVNAAELIIRRLDLRREEAAGEYAKKGKMYTSMGVLIGLSLALIAA